MVLSSLGRVREGAGPDFWLELRAHFLLGRAPSADCAPPPPAVKAHVDSRGIWARSRGGQMGWKSPGGSLDFACAPQSFSYSRTCVHLVDQITEATREGRSPEHTVKLSCAQLKTNAKSIEQMVLQEAKEQDSW